MSGLSEGTDFRAVRDIFGVCGTVKYAEVTDGVASIRFEQPQAAEMATQVTEMEGTAVQVSLLTGVEEKAYWERLWASQQAAHDRGIKGKGKGKGKGKRRNNKGKGRGA